jgi:hypothetical protein
MEYSLRMSLNTYVIQFHKGAPSASQTVFQVECEAIADMQATRYRDFLEKSLDIDYDFTICTQKFYLKEQGLI